jgi:hypothetical protein
VNQRGFVLRARRRALASTRQRQGARDNQRRDATRATEPRVDTQSRLRVLFLSRSAVIAALHGFRL